MADTLGLAPPGTPSWVLVPGALAGLLGAVWFWWRVKRFRFNRRAQRIGRVLAWR